MLIGQASHRSKKGESNELNKYIMNQLEISGVRKYAQQYNGWRNYLIVKCQICSEKQGHPCHKCKEYVCEDKKCLKLHSMHLCDPIE